jgi:hypothetical protein
MHNTVSWAEVSKLLTGGRWASYQVISVDQCLKMLPVYNASFTYLGMVYRCRAALSGVSNGCMRIEGLIILGARCDSRSGIESTPPRYATRSSMTAKRELSFHSSRLVFRAVLDSCISQYIP